MESWKLSLFVCKPYGSKFVCKPYGSKGFLKRAELAIAVKEAAEGNEQGEATHCGGRTCLYLYLYLCLYLCLNMHCGGRTCSDSI